MDTNVSTPQAVATVIAVEGQAFARDPSGQMRPLNAGDVLREGDTIVTPPGGQVQLAFLDGHMLTLLPNESFQFSAETAPTSRPDVAEAALPAGEADRIIQALERGENIDDQLDPTAAGLEGGGGNNAGNDFVRLLRIVEGVDPLAFQFGSTPAATEPPEFNTDSLAGQAQTAAAAPVVVGTVTLNAPASLAEGGAVAYTATVDVAPQGTPLVLTLSNGLSITIPVGAFSGTSAPLPVRVDDAYAQGDTSQAVSVLTASGGDYTTLDLGSPAATTVTDNADVTTVSLSASASVTEGGNIIYTASLDNAALTPVTITLSNGEVITIAAGATSGTVSVAAPSDDAYLDAGSLSASIVSASGGDFESLAIDSAAATTAILDTLDTTTLNLAASASVTEGGLVTYTASVDHAVTGSPLQVILSNGQTLSIPVGDTSASVDITAPDDVYSGGGSLSVTVTGTSGANYENLVIGSGAAGNPVVTTVTDDGDVTTVALSASASVTEGGSIVYTASLDHAAQSPVTVTLDNSLVITIAAGATSGSASVVADDDVYLDAGNVSATIASAVGGNFEALAIDPTPAVTFVNDDSDVTTISLSGDGSVAEGAAATYTVSLTSPAQTDVTVNLSYSGTAANGADFSGVASVTILAGASAASFSVATLDDAIAEGTESFTVGITSASGGNFESLVVSGSANSVTTTVADNDATTVSLTATPSVSEAGGDITYTASASQAPVSDLTLTLSNGAVITILAGQTSGSTNVALAARDDVYAETDSVNASIVSASGGGVAVVIDPTPATTTISDTINVTTVSLTATASVAEGGSIIYTASLGNPAGTPVSVSLDNGETITIAAGASSGSVSVAAPGDDVYLDAGSVSASISSASGGNFESLAINPAPAITSISDTLDTTTLSLTATPSTTEGGSIVYTASLNNVAQTAVSVTLDNGATITIAAGASSGTVSVAAPGDDVYLDAGSVSTTIASASGGNFENLVINPAAATTAVSDTLDTTTLSLTASGSVAEGGNILYSASLDNPAGTPVTVTLSNGAVINIAAGASSGSVSVPAPANDVYVNAGNVSATIASASGGNFEALAISPVAAVTSVTDTLDTTTVSLTATPSVAEGGSIIYTASLTSAAQTAMTVTLSDGTVISIAAGASSGNASVAAPTDDVYVDAGSVNATIASAAGGNFESLAINPAPATTTITDTLDVTTLSLTADASVAEGGNITYTASLDHVAQTPVTVTLSNGASITIAAGMSSGTVSVAAPVDDVYLDAGTVDATITSAAGGNFENLAIDPAAAATSITDTLDTTTLSLTADASVAEGGSITYTASLDHAAQTPVSVTLSNGTVISIAAGASSGSVSVAAPADDVYVDAGSVSATIASATGGNFENLAIDPTAAATSITDTLDVTTVSLTATASVAEGGSITYTASLTSVAQSPVNVALSNGATINIAAGASSGSVSVAAPADDVYLDAGSVSATIASASGGNFESLAVNPAAATTTITDTIDTATLSLSGSASVAEGGTASYLLSLTSPAQTAVTVNLSYSGTATNGADYTGVTSVTIPAGSSSAAFSIPLLNDLALEGTETLIVGIASASGGNFENLAISGTASSVTTGIIEGTTAATLSLSADGSVAEGGVITYTASLTGPALTPLTVTLSNGTTINIAAGASSGSASVAAPSDDVYVDAGSVSASIASTLGGGFSLLTVDPLSATTTITDTVDVTTISLTADTSVAEGGSITYTASLNNVAQTPVTLTLSNGATISIAAGASSGTVSVPAPADDAYVDAGSISATIASAAGGNFEALAINSAAATTSITDTVDTTTLSLSADASVAEGGNITYTASLTNVAQAPVTITLSNGATISIAAGASTGTASVAAPSDDVYMDASSVSATIASATGGNFESLAINPAAVVTSITDTVDVTTVSLTADAVVAEGGSITYTASLNNVAQTPLSVTLSNGAVISIAAGASSGSVSVAAPSDDVYVDAGSVSATIASAVGGNFESLTVNPVAATTSITDTADVTTLSLTADAVVAEGGSISYTASLNNVAQTPVTITLSNGATITIAAGASSGTVGVPAPADDAYVDAGSVSATIASAIGGNFESLAIDSTAATTSITDTLDITTVKLSADASVAEGGSITYTASLDNLAQTPVTVTLSNGATISIAAGASTGTVSVAAPSDNVYLDAGSVSATIASATGGNFENLVIDPVATTTAITDTLNVTTLSLTADAVVAEGGNITYTASLDNVAQTPVTVTLSNGASITIAAGAVSGSVSVAAPVDDVYVDAGSVSATIVTAAGGNFENLAINPAAATTSITDTLDVTTLSISGDGSVAEGASASYTLSLTSPAQSAVTVNLSYSGTAANGTDFSGVASVTIAAGASSASFSLATFDDTLAEGAESFSVGIAGATGGNFENLVVSGAASSVSTTIVDNDTTTVSLGATPTLTEAGGTLVYTANVTQAPVSDLTLTLSNGASITILAGQTSGSTSVAVASSDDVYLDPDSLSASIALATGGGVAVVIDPTPAVTTLSDTIDVTTLSLNASPSVAEGGVITYTASLSNAAQTPVTVTLSSGATITIAAGASSGAVSVAAPADNVYLDAGNVSVTIASAAGGNFESLVIDPTAATTAITDTLATTTVSLAADASVAEGGSIVYTASLDNVAQTPVTVALSNGAVISIAAGAASGSVSVAAPADDVYLDAGSVSATIASAAGGNFEALAIDPAAATTTITDTLDTTTLNLTASASVIEGGTVTYTASVGQPVTGSPLLVSLSNGLSISIPVGAASASVSMTAPDDAYAGGASLSATVTDTSGANYEALVIGSGAAGSPVVTTVTDDADATTVSLSASGSVAEGGAITYTAILSNAAQTPVSVTLSNGTVISIAAGAASGSVSVAAPADDVYVDAGSVSATISSATGGNFEALVIDLAAATTSISDTLDTTTLSLTADASMAEGGSITYTASLTSAAQTPVSVILSNGATITIAAGTASGSVSVAAPADDVYVDAGSVSATISSATGGNFEALVIDPAAATTTITDTLDVTTVSLTADASVAEGGSITYTASLNNVAQTPVSVTLSNGAVISIAAGSASGSVSVAAPADDVYADAGSVSASIASAAGGNFESLAIDPATATTTITDTLDVTTLSLIATPSVAEGGSITYTASLDNAAQTPVTVTLSNGATISIAAGASSGSVSVAAPADDVYLDAGSVSATIASAMGGNFESLAIDPTAAATTITDTLDTTTLSISGDASVAEGASASYTLSLTSPAQSAVTVNLAYSGTAANGADFSGIASVTIAAGASSASFSVATLDDAIVEGAESFTVGIAGAVGGNFENLVVSGSANSVSTSIIDNDTTTLSVSSPSVLENAGYAQFTVSLSNASSQSTVVDLALTNGSAIAADFGPGLEVSTDGGTTWLAATTATIPALQTSVLVRTPIINDALDEASETFSLTATRTAGTPLTNPGGEATGTATIIDDDPTPSLSIDSVTVNEGAGTATFTVSLSAASGQTVAVNYGTGNGTALSGADYTAANGTLTFNPGTTSQTITVPILNDAVYEGAESFNVMLSGAINASIASATGVGTILDNGSGAGGTDNDMPMLAVSSPTIAEDGGYAQFSVSLSNPSTSAVVFTPSLGSGTALLGIDTTAAGTLEVSTDNGATWSTVSGNVSIATGSTSVLLRLAITDDTLVEGTESLALTATVVGGGTANTTASGTATITDNDAIVVSGTTSDDDDVNENRDALAGNDIVHTGVIGNVAPGVALAIDDSAPSGLTSGGEAVTYSWDAASRTLTASSASGTVFTVTLNAANDGYAFTQFRSIDHPAVAGENQSLDIPLTLVARDAGGTPFTSSVFNVTVYDDAPSVSGNPAITTENDGSFIESGFLGQATLSNDITGVVWNTAALPALVFDGKPVLYVDHGDGTLTGELADGTLIFRATIDPTVVDANNHPQYSFELLNTLGRLGSEGSTTSYTVISGGNISNLNLGFGGYLVDSMTAVDGTNAVATVNTNNNWIGVGGNWFNAGDQLFMSFTDVAGNAGQVRGLDMVVEGQGSAPYTLNWTVTAAIDYAGNTITYSGTMSGTGNADVPFSIPLAGGALYFTNLEISDPAGSGDFRIALSGVSANDYFSDIPLALDYTLTDADGDTAGGLIDVTLTAGNIAPLIGVAAASASVSEEGLLNGLMDASGSPADTTNSTVITGTMAISDPDGPAPSVTLDWPGTPPAITSGGVAVTWSGTGTNTLVGSAGGAEVVRIAITNDGSYTVTLSKAVDHAGANVEDILAFDVKVSATDGVATTTGTLTVNIEDDSAVVGNLTQAVTVPQQDTNLMIILDVSGSMDQSSGIAGQTRLEAAQSAINQLIDRYDGLGNVAVRVVYFSTGASWSGSVWVDAATGKSQVSALNASGMTNYDAALADAMAAFAHSGKISGAQNVSYFLSDGAPTYSNNNVNTLSDSNRTGSNNADEGIQANEEAIWTTFLNNNDVKSYALGIGTGLPSNAQTLLNPIAYDGTGTGTNTNSTIVTDMSQLSAALQATVPPATVGNLLTGNVAFGSGGGADGGYMPAVSLDGTTYTFDSGTGAITVSGSGGSGYVYDSATHELTITTSQGGTLLVDMDNGQYSYTPSGTMAGTVTETIGFSLTDADGDTSGGTLTLNVSREGSTVSGTSGTDTLIGTTGADILIGGAGNDTLSGLVGGDTFKWNLADHGTTAVPARDTITDFDLVVNSDKLDLRDLLQGELHTGTNAGNLADYLHFSYDSATSTTVLEVKSQGAAMTGPDQIINLNGVDLVTGTTSDQQIIQDLLTKGKLITD